MRGIAQVGTTLQATANASQRLNAGQREAVWQGASGSLSIGARSAMPPQPQIRAFLDF